MKLRIVLALVLLSSLNPASGIVLQDQEPYIYGSQSHAKKVGLPLTNHQTMSFAKKLLGVWVGKNKSGSISATLQFWMDQDKLVGALTDNKLTNEPLVNFRLTGGTLFFTTEGEIEQGGYIMKMSTDGEISLHKVLDTSKMLSEDEATANKLMGEYKIKLKQPNKG
jgi:hypothetical protein